jgi:hypothetical protein
MIPMRRLTKLYRGNRLLSLPADKSPISKPLMADPPTNKPPAIDPPQLRGSYAKNSKISHTPFLQQAGEIIDECNMYLLRIGIFLSTILVIITVSLFLICIFQALIGR